MPAKLDPIWHFSTGRLLPMLLAVALGLAASAACLAQGALPPGTPQAGSGGMAPSDAPAVSTVPQELQGAQLLAALRQGGYVLFMRHGATDMRQNDSDPTHLGNCAAQRNLTGGGQAEVTAVGKSIKALGIPIGQVLTSPYCRARDTALLAFGRGQITEALNPKPGTDEAANRAAIGKQLRQLLSQAPAQGTNTVLVAHADNVAAAANLSLAEGEVAVFQPLPNGFQLVGSIKPDQWSSLVP